MICVTEFCTVSADAPPAVEAYGLADETADGAKEDAAVTTELSRGEILAILSRVNWTVFTLYLVVVAAVLVARQIRLAGERNIVRIAFADGPEVSARAGLSVLEIAEQRDIAIAHLCRGRARCGTCRVRLSGGDASLPAPDPEEALTLVRVGASVGERLACQLRPGPGILAVERVLAPYVRPGDLHRTSDAPLPTTAEGTVA